MCSHLTSSHHCVPTHLEDEQLAPGHLRELRDGLNRRGAGADDADAEALECREVLAGVGPVPAGGVEGLALWRSGAGGAVSERCRSGAGAVPERCRSGAGEAKAVREKTYAVVHVWYRTSAHTQRSPPPPPFV
jgi:hypothetical protein